MCLLYRLLVIFAVSPSITLHSKWNFLWIFSAAIQESCLKFLLKLTFITAADGCIGFQRLCRPLAAAGRPGGHSVFLILAGLKGRILKHLGLRFPGDVQLKKK